MATIVLLLSLTLTITSAFTSKQHLQHSNLVGTQQHEISSFRLTKKGRSSPNNGFRLASSVVENDVTYEKLSLPAREGRPLKVAIAGGGVGGLTAALCMLKKGMDVTVYEKTAAFARFGGPIQFASNALSVLKEIDDTLFDRIMERFTFTGTRTCGIKDGLRADGSFRMTEDSLDYLWNPEAPADWFVRFPLKVRLRLFAITKDHSFVHPNLHQCCSNVLIYLAYHIPGLSIDQICKKF